ncbi:MAG: hypothetical protein ABFC96_09510 [Thermoguttaceae bacterium]
MATPQAVFHRTLLRVARDSILACAVLCLAIAGPAHGQGQFDTLRQDVRTPNPGDPSPPASPSGDPYASSKPDLLSNFDDDAKSTMFLGTLCLGGIALSSPLWGPYALAGDDFSTSRWFAPFPYDNVPGYMTMEGLEHSRPWSCQLSADYATGLGDLDSTGGHLLLSTASRFGADTSARYLRERLPGDRQDSLWLGDGNLVFCFARNEQMQWRTGLGLNWLDDRQQTDFGFNFTYGFDWFPRKPWVASTEIDWGTLGRSGLFHFRGTVGVLVNRFEAYTGYEYYDFDRVHSNSLIGGVRLWF